MAEPSTDAIRSAAMAFTPQGQEHCLLVQIILECATALDSDPAYEGSALFRIRCLTNDRHGKE